MHIVITGGTRGIGKGLVIEFLKRGHHVSFTGTKKESIEKASKDLDGSFYGIVCDVRRYEDILHVKELAVNTFGPIDIWINNAGIDQSRNDISDMTFEEMERVVNINVLGMISGTSIALNVMKQQGYGMVYNMEGLGSNNMKIAQTVLYGSTKRLLTYFSKACNKELKAYKHVSVGTLSPGMVFTDLLLGNTTEESLKITSILGNKVEEVTPYLVKKMLKGTQYIYWLTTPKILWRFMMSPFRKKVTSFDELQ